MAARAVALATSVAGCGTTATIHRTHGPAYEAEIVRSSDRSLEVAGEDGQTYVVPREQISGIDHPGNVTFTVGVALMALAAVAVGSVVSESQGDVNSTGTAVTVGLVYGLPGLVMAAWGGANWLSSTSKARALEISPRPSPLLAPPDQPYPPPPGPWNRPLVRKPSVTPEPGPAARAPVDQAPNESSAPTQPEPEVVVPAPASPDQGQSGQ